MSNTDKSTDGGSAQDDSGTPQEGDWQGHSLWCRIFGHDPRPGYKITNELDRTLNIEICEDCGAWKWTPKRGEN